MKRLNCDMLDLRAMLAIFDFGSFQQAADSLNLSQPSLSRRLQSLETMLGVTLFDRTTRRVAPTGAGRGLAPMFRQLLHEFDDCVFSLRDFGVTLEGQLTIAAIPTATSAFLPKILSDFKTTYPNFHFRILDLSNAEGLDCVARGEAEFGIASVGASRPELTFTPLLDDEFALVCRRDHPFADKARLRWRDLVGQPLIISQKSDNRAIIDQALARLDIQLNWTFEVGHLATSFGLVETGVGMSIVPRMSRPRDRHPLIAVVPMSDPVVKRTVGLVERKGVQLSRAAATLREMIVTACRVGAH